MKVLWIVLGVLLCLCLACGGAGYWIYSKGSGAISDADRYAHDSLQLIASRWDEKEFEQRAAPEIGEKNGKGAIPSFVSRLSKTLGPIKGDFAGHLTGFYIRNNNGESVTYADWATDATFEKGPASVSIQLIDRNGKWAIGSFVVTSTLLGDGKASIGADLQQDGTKIEIGH